MKFYYKVKNYFLPILSVVILFLFPLQFIFADVAVDSIPVADEVNNVVEGVGSYILGNFFFFAIIVLLAATLIKSLLWFSVWLLDQSVVQFVGDLHTWLNITAIDSGWKIIRDFSNMIFIFILLYIAVSTILSLADYKKQLAIVLVTAVLVNFSLAFTKFTIDVSNKVTVEAYNKILNVMTTAPNVTSSGSRTNLAWFILDQLNASPTGEPSLSWSDGDKQSAVFSKAGQTAPTASTTNEGVDNLAGTFIDSIQIDGSNAPGGNPIFTGGILLLNGILTILTWIIKVALKAVLLPISPLWDFAKVAIMNMIASGIMIYLFTFIAAVFIFRFVILVFLLMTSAAAVASYALPKLKSKIWNPWSQHLVEQLLIAPVLMLMLLMTVKIISDPVFQNQTSLAGIIIKYMIVIGLLVGTLKVAKEVSSNLSEMAGKLTKNAVGKAAGASAGITAIAARGTLGRMSDKFAEKNKAGLAGMRNSSNYLTKGLGHGLTGITNWEKKSSFDVRNTDTGKTAFKKYFDNNGTDLLNNKLKKKPAGYVALRDARAESIEKEKAEDLKILKNEIKETEKKKEEASSKIEKGKQNITAPITKQKEKIADLKKKKEEQAADLTQAKMTGASASEIEELRNIALETTKEIQDAEKELPEILQNVKKTSASTFNTLQEEGERINQGFIDRQIKNNKVYQEALNHIEHYAEHGIRPSTKKGMAEALKRNENKNNEYTKKDSEKKENELKETVKKLEEEVDNLKNK
jgi:hypothetical protein